ARDSLKRKHLFRTHMEFARNGHAVTHSLELLYHRTYSLLNGSVVSMCPMLHRIHSGEQRASGWSAGRRGSKSVLKYHRLAAQLIEVGCTDYVVSIWADVHRPEVVSNKHDQVGERWLFLYMRGG